MKVYEQVERNYRTYLISDEYICIYLESASKNESCGLRMESHIIISQVIRITTKLVVILISCTLLSVMVVGIIM